MRWIAPLIITLFLSSCGMKPAVPKEQFPFGGDKLGPLVKADSALLPKNDSSITPFGMGRILLGDSLQKIFRFFKPDPSKEETIINGTRHYYRSIFLGNGNTVLKIETDSAWQFITGLSTNNPRYTTPSGFRHGTLLDSIRVKKEILHPYAENGLFIITLEHEGLEIVPDTATQRRYFSSPDYKIESDTLAFVDWIRI